MHIARPVNMVVRRPFKGKTFASPNSKQRRSEKMDEPFIFVSYRRSDTTPYTLALKAELEHRLRSAFVFVDIERIQATDRWPEILDNALSRARVLILMIGARWIECEDCAERPRLFDENDWVRKEVVSFLLKKPLSILPVLVDGAKMPSVDELPA